MKAYLQLFFCGMLFGAGCSVMNDLYKKKDEIKTCVKEILK